MATVKIGEIHPGARRDGELAVRWRERGDRAARDLLFEQHLPLARRLASRYVNPHEPLEDLVQVAAVGLLKAVDRFDPGRGTRFATFAVPTIVGELKRYLRDAGWSAHVPRGAQEMALRVDRASHRITARTGRPARVAELAQYLEVSIEDVLTGLDAGTAHHAVSLDAPAPGTEPEDGASLVDTLGAGEDGYGLVETGLSLRAAIARLADREHEALRLRVAHDLTQTEIAERMGCSQMQVSRLLRRAVATVRELTDPDLSTA